MSRTAVVAPRLRPGQPIDDYEILWLIAESGASTLYLVRPWHDHQFLRNLSRWGLGLRLWLVGSSTEHAKKLQLGVLKIARPEFASNLHDEHEYLARKQYTHANLVQMYSRRFDVSTRRRHRDIAFVALTTTTGQLRCPYLVLAYEPGIALEALLSHRRQHPLPGPIVVAMALQVASALAHLHQQGLVHHDVKPANILLRQTAPLWQATAPNVVLLDLGAADRLDQPHHCSIYGTRLYLPPESLRETNPDPASIQVDIYSLGRTLYELLTGSLEAESTVELRDIRRQQPRVRQRNTTVSPALDALIADATQRDVVQRRIVVPSITDLIERLANTPEAKQSARYRHLTMRRLAARLGVVFVLGFVFVSAMAFMLLPLHLSAEVPFPPATVTPLGGTPTASATATTSPQPMTPTPFPTSTRVPTSTPTKPRHTS